jgi:hypothetical protein
VSRTGAETFSPGVERLYARYLDEGTLALVRVVCAETARAFAALAAPVSHGYLAWQLALGVGLPMSLASKAGTILDALQPLIDLTDNLADEALDRAQGRPLEARYPGVAREVLQCLPPLMMACVIAALHEDFAGSGCRPRDAAARLIRALGHMTLGQGQREDHPERVDNIAGHQGTLLCLALWLAPESARDAARDAAIERWAFGYGRLWQLRQDVLDARDPHAPARFEDTREAVREAWPDFAPFTPGGAFAHETLLGRRPP